MYEAKCPVPTGRGRAGGSSRPRPPGTSPSCDATTAVGGQLPGGGDPAGTPPSSRRLCALAAGRVVSAAPTPSAPTVTECPCPDGRPGRQATQTDIGRRSRCPRCTSSHVVDEVTRAPWLSPSRDPGGAGTGSHRVFPTSASLPTTLQRVVRPNPDPERCWEAVSGSSVGTTALGDRSCQEGASRAGACGKQGHG